MRKMCANAAGFNDNISKRGGGVATYICNRYGKYSQVLPDLSEPDGNLEQLWIEVKAPNHKRMLIANVYTGMPDFRGSAEFRGF